MNQPAPHTPYDEPQLKAMKQDIADRSFRIRMTGMAITALFAVIGIATMVMFPAAIGSAAMAKALVYGAVAVGGAVTTVITMREAKKLEIDEQYIQSYMQGKNYWGEGYRKEVAEHGYSGPPLAMQGPPMKSHHRGAARE